MIINSANALSQLYSAYTNKQSDSESIRSAENRASDTVSLSETGRQAEARWKEIAGNYDVHSLSQEGAQRLSRDLFEGGFISSSEMMAISAPFSMNENAGGERDLLADMRTTLKLSSGTDGYTQQARETYLNSISVLERLAATRSE